MVWSAFSGYDNVVPSCKSTAIDFVDIEYKKALACFYFLHNHPNDMIIMEDGASIHHNSDSKRWTNAYNMSKLDWPPNLF